MRTQSYPSDITDRQWALIEPHIPVYPGGRPRKTNLRDVIDAILYILRTGCQWRYLPKDFPPKSTTWRYFDEWRHNGTLDAIHDRLRTKVRAREKPYAPRTTASVDSQSVDRMALPCCDPVDRQALRQTHRLSAAVINSACRVSRGRVING
jgi:putative transposase